MIRSPFRGSAYDDSRYELRHSRVTTATSRARDILFFFFNDTATTEIYTLSLHDALPILPHRRDRRRPGTALCRGLRRRGTARAVRSAQSVRRPADVAPRHRGGARLPAITPGIRAPCGRGKGCVDRLPVR